MVKISDLFMTATFADNKLRYVVPNAKAIEHDIFQTYAPSEMFKACAHELLITDDFEFSESILDFTTEGRWLMLMSYKHIQKNGYFPIMMNAVIRFESEGDRALFRLMLP